MLNLSPEERFAVFIDGANFHANTKALNFDVDFEKLLTSLKSTGKMVRTYYYTALPDGTEYSTIKRIADWLDYNGYTVVSKPWRDFTNIETGQRRIKGNMDIELALDMMKLSRHIDHAVLFSGDGDFCRLVTEIQDIGVKVTIVSSVKTRPPFLNDGLRRQADHFIDIADVYHIFERAPLDPAAVAARRGDSDDSGGSGSAAGESAEGEAQVLHKQRDYTGGGY